VDVERARRCADCGSPLRPDQRYCISCGARLASRSRLLEALLRRTVGGAEAPASPQHAASSPGAAHERGPGLTLPSPRVSALLVLAFLGFGVIIGDVVSSPVQSSLAASRGPMKLILPRATTAGTSAPTAGAGSPAGSSSAASEPPLAEAEATPSAGSSASSGAAAPAKSKPPAGTAPASSSSGSERKPAGGSATTLPRVKHVFVIMLSDEPFASVFGPSSSAPYLSKTLERRGELLVRYYGVAHAGLADGIALLSGQGPTDQTAANCPTFADITPGRAMANQQVLGQGCVYPPSTGTLPAQLAAKHLQWRAYVQGIGEGAVAACAHPALGQVDPTAAQAPAGQGYATFRNPLVYFHSVIDSRACQLDDVGLGRLGGDLSSAKRTPSFSYIVPDRCHDGDSVPCAPGAPAGMAPADAFLGQVVPKILASKAYKDGGLLLITVDQAPASGEFADSSSCCGQPQFPNLTAGAPAGATHRGGGQVGALLLSPFVKPASTSQEPFNHFSLLRTIEDLYGLAHLGYAGLPSVSSMPASLFSARKG
jgi:hypothetical protein